VLTAIDAPVQDVTLLFAVDWFVWVWIWFEVVIARGKSLILGILSCRDRIRTTNNMLGDCYTAAIVEELSRKELMALDAASVNYQVW